MGIQELTVYVFIDLSIDQLIVSVKVVLVYNWLPDFGLLFFFSLLL